MRRNRSGESLPPARLDLESADRLTLYFPQDWLDAHPLTRLDLEQEADYLAVVPFTLTVLASG